MPRDYVPDGRGRWPAVHDRQERQQENHGKPSHSIGCAPHSVSFTFPVHERFSHAAAH